MIMHRNVTMMGWWWLLCQLGEDRFPREFKMQSELLKNLSIYYSLFNRYLKDLTSFITGPWILVSQDQASIDPKSRQVKSINVIHVLLYMVLLNNIDLSNFGNLKVNSKRPLKKTHMMTSKWFWPQSEFILWYT